MMEPGAGVLARPVLAVLFQSAETNRLVLGSVGFVGGLVLMAVGVQRYRKGRLVADTATENARSVAVGQTELEGRAEPLEEPIRQPFVADGCLYASWQVEEYRQVETGQVGNNPLEDSPLDDGPVRDALGGGNGGEWRTVASSSYTAPFLITDETGAVVVAPGSSRDVTWRLTDECTTQWTFDSGEEPQAGADGFSPRESMSTDESSCRRYTQTVLPSGAETYVFGQAVPTDHDEFPGHDLKLERDSATDRFIVSNMDETGLRSFYNRRGPLYVLVGAVICVGSLYVALSLVV